MCAVLAKKLYLDSNKIGDIGAEKLAEALSNLKNLQETWLDSLSLTMDPHSSLCVAHTSLLLYDRIKDII